MRVNRGCNVWHDGSEIGNKLHQAMHIIRFREACLPHPTTFFQQLITVKEAISSDQCHTQMFRPTAYQRPQYAGGCTFPHRDTASNTDNVRNALPVSTKKLFQNCLTAQIRAYIEVQQT